MTLGAARAAGRRGGGRQRRTGVAAGPAPEEIPAHTARVRRLIGLHEQARAGGTQ